MGWLMDSLVGERSLFQLSVISYQLPLMVCLGSDRCLGSFELDKSRLGRTTVLAELPEGKPNNTFTFSVYVGLPLREASYVTSTQPTNTGIVRSSCFCSW
ncbi:MAG: hypothetical protein F6K18_27790 [Okeania sp. SIO2C2]|uniref:hypothetical protein n=1 Tax=Okeania sp. SIO2C2 TaxID=2607787 RepID=UPI0013BAE4B1|nr:hypothetical protein [Okeania sp. SIO2C2]NEP90325.1 hypothetical protein [Okeania sp. SIO2C2]